MVRRGRLLHGVTDFGCGWLLAVLQNGTSVEHQYHHPDRTDRRKIRSLGRNLCKPSGMRAKGPLWGVIGGSAVFGAAVASAVLAGAWFMWLTAIGAAFTVIGQLERPQPED